jgi:hypothetical protein
MALLVLGKKLWHAVMIGSDEEKLKEVFAR